jgi:phosphoserine phosphatase RsbU/P
MKSTRHEDPPSGGRAPEARESLIQNPLRSEFKRAVRRDLEDLYGFYVDERRRERLESMGRLRRTLFLLGWSLKSMFLKLTPARRTLLFLSVVCLAVGRISFEQGNTELHINLHAITIAILLLIVMLELKDKLLVRDEIEAGRAVQLALLPEHSPEVAGWRIWLWSRPANDVGGDLADYLWTGDQKLGLTLGDVAGKGLGAALLMAKLQATVRAIAPDYLSLAELGARINRIMCRDCDPTRFATLIFAEVGANAGEVRLLNAGHPPPSIIRATTVETLPPVAVPIGLVPDALFVEQRVDLETGDAIVLYSDGVTEASNRGGEFYGEERLEALLPSLRGMHAEDIGRRIIEDVDRFVGDAKVSDDLSLVILERV